MKRLALLLVLLQVVGLPVLVSAQSLGDIARKEEERRKQVKKPSKVYTNRDLRGGDEPPAVTKVDSAAFGGAAGGSSTSPEVTPPGTAAAAGEQSATAEEGGASRPDASSSSSREDWEKKLADARAQLSRSQMFAEALQTRINSLTADFTARDDPAQRAALETERKRSLSELDRVKRDIADQTKAIADIQEQARRAGVPAGWVR